MSRAFSILEMVVAAAVFAISVLVLFGIFPITARSVSQAEQRLLANHLASNRLELLRTSAFDGIQDQLPQAVAVEFVHNKEVIELEYQVEQKVVTAAADPGLKNVEVIVRWHFRKRDQELRLETQVARLSL